tara:strand:+ start:29521 stop:30648 length:1128 start_codon:yes stop_codon:yes gene_type:complete
MWRACPRSEYRWFQTESEVDNFFNTKTEQKIRSDLYNGTRNSNCGDCYTAEDSGGMSYRKVLKKDYAVDNANSVIVKAPKVLELKFSNLCNLKCVFCASVCSSLWEHELGLPQQYVDNQKVSAEYMRKSLFEWLKKNIKHVDSIMYLGGEPAIQPEFYEIVDLLVNNKPDWVGQKELTFSTNTYYPEAYRKKFETALQRVLDAGHTVFPRISLDGIGNKQSYQRTNLRWDHFEKNMLSFLEKFNTKTNGIRKIRANIALNIVNLVYCGEIVQYLDSVGFGDIEPHYNYIVRPEMFYMRHWGNKLNTAIDIIQQQDFKNHSVYKDHIIKMAKSFTNLEPNIDHINETKKWLDEYDNKQGFNFLEMFPENRYMFNEM